MLVSKNVCTLGIFSGNPKRTVDVRIGRVDDVLEVLEVDCQNPFEFHFGLLAFGRFSEEHVPEVLGVGGKDLKRA